MTAPPEDATSGLPSRAYAATLVFLRFLVLPAWAVAVFLVWQHGPTLSELPGSDVGALIPKGIPAERSEREIDRIFGSSLLPRIAVVQRDPGGIDVDRQRAIVRQAIALAEGRLAGDYPPHSIAAPCVNSSRLFPAARERSTTAITYIAFPSNVEINHQRNLAAGYADELTRTTGVEARSTGFVPGNLEQSQAVNDHLVWVTLAVVALILGLYMRSVLAPVVTLAAAGVSWILSTRAVAWMGLETGLTLQQEVEPIVAVLLLGVVTDYSVFFLPGARARLLAGGGRLETARQTTAQFIPIVFTAGVLVAARADDAAGRVDRLRQGARPGDGDRRHGQHARQRHARPGADRAARAEALLAGPARAAVRARAAAARRGSPRRPSSRCAATGSPARRSRYGASRALVMCPGSRGWSARARRPTCGRCAGSSARRTGTRRAT